VNEAKRLMHARGELILDRCLVMGIVNRTPDSFYDGGRTELDDARDHALRLVDEGAAIIDLGGVRAGPGPEVSREEESERLLPLVEAIASRAEIVISVETADPEIARSAMEAGAAIVNDVTSLADEEMAGVCAETGAGLVLMHSGGQIRGRPRHPTYDDVVDEVRSTWEELASTATGKGVRAEQLIADTGLDFGKNTFQSLELSRRLGELTEGPWPVLVAPSRKDVVGETLALEPGERLEGTLSLVSLAAWMGAAIVRVHDVQAAVRTVEMTEAVSGRRMPAAPRRGLWD
jgi:dihydropteroate synthase